MRKTTPKDVYEKVKSYLPHLKSTNFSDIEKLKDTSFSAVYSMGKNAPQYITSDKLTSMKNPSIWDVRAFLFNELRLSELYSGDGYTYHENGVKGIPEYIGNNADISKLRGAKVVEINTSSLPSYRHPAGKILPQPNCESFFKKLK